MAKEQPQEEAEAAAPAPAKASFLSPKVLLFGGVIFLVQLVVIFFVIKFFIAPQGAEGGRAVEAEQPAAAEGHGEENPEDAKSIYIVKDVIVNPASTNGTRFLLTTVGFEVKGPEALKELELKEVQVRDALITILTSKDLGELVDPTQRDTLRSQISRQVAQFLKGGSLKNVYFSKFVIQ